MRKNKTKLSVKNIQFFTLLTFSFLFCNGFRAGENEVYLYSTLFIVSSLLLWFGYWQRNYFFKLFSGMLMCVTGVYLFINGIPGSLTDSWLQPGQPDGWIFFSAITLFGLGLYYFVQTAYETAWGYKDD